MNITNLKELTRDKDLSIRKLDESYYFVINEDTYEANEIGATIVNAAGRDLSIDDLCIRISDKYVFDNFDQIKSDIVNYIEFLLSEGILINE